MRHSVIMALQFSLELVLGFLGTGGIAAGIITWWRFRNHDAALTENLKVDKEIKLYDAAMKLAQRLGEEVKEQKIELDNTERKLSEVRATLNDLEEKYREERHTNRNLEQRSALMVEEIAELKAKHDTYINLLNDEIDRLKHENKLLKQKLPK